MIPHHPLCFTTLQPVRSLETSFESEPSSATLPLALARTCLLRKFLGADIDMERHNETRCKVEDVDPSDDWVTDSGRGASTSAFSDDTELPSDPLPLKDADFISVAEGVGCDPCPEVLRMIDYKDRLQSFAEENWLQFFEGVEKLDPSKMARIGWYCTGEKTTKCFACFRELEGWEETDDPVYEHNKRGNDCPLVTLGFQTGPSNTQTLQERLRLEVAIVYKRKHEFLRRQEEKVLRRFDEALGQVNRKLSELKAGRHDPYIFELGDRGHGSHL